MNIQIIILLLVLFYYLAIGNKQHDSKAKNRFIWFSCLLFALESGLRHICVGPDTRVYYYYFMEESSYTWAEIFFGFFDQEYSNYREPAFAVVEKAFSTIIPSWQMFLIILGLLYYYAMGNLWSRYIQTSTGVLLAVMLVLSLFSIIALSGIRQQITMTLSMLLIPYVEDRRWKIVVPLVLLGSLIHISFLFYLAFIPFQYIKQNNYRMLLAVSIISIPIIIVLSRNIVGFMASQMENEYYMGYAIDTSDQAKPYVFIILYTILSVYQFVNYNVLSTAPHFYLSALVLMTITFPLTMQDTSLIRIGQYFTIYLMLSLPYILDRKKDKSIYWIMMAVLLYAIVKNPINYHFFWEQIGGYYFQPFGLTN